MRDSAQRDRPELKRETSMNERPVGRRSCKAPCGIGSRLAPSRTSRRKVLAYWSALLLRLLFPVVALDEHVEQVRVLLIALGLVRVWVEGTTNLEPGRLIAVFKTTGVPGADRLPALIIGIDLFRVGTV